MKQNPFSLIRGWRRTLLIILAFLILCALFGIGLQRIFAVSTPGLDLYISWVAGRALLLEGQDPYSPEITREIQLGMHGRLLEAGEDPMRFAYPPYAVLLLTPLLPLTFDWTQAFWLSFNILILAICLRLAFPSTPAWIPLIAFLYYPVGFGLILGNFAVLLTGIIILCLGKLIFNETGPSQPAQPSRTLQVQLGLLLAITSIKPQYSWLFVVILCIHALRKRQWPFLVALAGGMVFFLSVSFLLLPDWPARWLSRLGEYTQDNPLQSPLHDYLKVFIPASSVNVAVQVAVMVIVLSVIWVLIAWQRGRVHPIAMLAWCGAAVYLLDANGIAYDQIPFLIPQIIWAGAVLPRPKAGAWVLLLTAAASWLLFWLGSHGVPQAADRLTFVVSLPWIAAMFLVSGKRFDYNRRLWTSRN